MNCTHVIVSLLNLEVDCGRDRVRLCRLLTPIKIVPPEIVLPSISVNNNMSPGFVPIELQVSLYRQITHYFEVYFSIIQLIIIACLSLLHYMYFIKYILNFSILIKAF